MTKEERKEYNKNYRKNNKERIKKLRDKWRFNNKEKDKQSKKLSRIKNFENIKTYTKKRDLKRYYNFSWDKKEEILKKQDYKCLGCGNILDINSRNCCIDHDHYLGDVRGILCLKCNAVLGFVKDSSEVLLNLVKYIKPWEEKKEVLKQLSII